MRVSAGVQPICNEGEWDPRKPADGFLLQDHLEPKALGLVLTEQSRYVVLGPADLQAAGQDGRLPG